jgi:hypothetical protein
VEKGLGGAGSGMKLRCVHALASYGYAGMAIDYGHPETYAEELWPSQWRTPRNLLQGPTVLRYWWAMILEIWCR